MTKLPNKDEITFRWLIDHFPVWWWAAIGVALASIFSAGVLLGRVSFQNLDGDVRSKIAVRDQLQSDIQELSTEKTALADEIVKLQVEKKVNQLSPEQIREELKNKWSRD